MNRGDSGRLFLLPRYGLNMTSGSRNPGELKLAVAQRLLYDRLAALQPSRFGVAVPGGPMAIDQTLIQIRERSYLDLLDLALLVVRQRPRTLGLAAAAGIVPFVALNYWVLSHPDTPQAIWPALLLLEAPWATVPLTLVLGGLMFERPPRPVTILWRMIRALPSLFILHLLVRGILAMSVVLLPLISGEFWFANEVILLAMSVILLPLIPGQFWFANEVILLEKTPPFRALRRCFQLSRGRSGEFVLLWLAQLMFGLLFALCFWIGTGAGISALIKSELTWYRPFLTDSSGLRFQLGIWIAIAFFAVARFLNYIDQRIRTEGWELRLRLQAVGRDLEEAQPCAAHAGISVLALLLVAPAGALGQGQTIMPDAGSRVRVILKERAFPWYDGESDRVKPLLPAPSSWTSWLEKRLEPIQNWLDGLFSRRTDQGAGPRGSSLRGFLATLLFVAGGCTLLVWLWRLWRTFEPQAMTQPDQAVRIGDAARIAGLDSGAALEGIDPWAERCAGGRPAMAPGW